MSWVVRNEWGDELYLLWEETLPGQGGHTPQIPSGTILLPLDWVWAKMEKRNKGGYMG